MRSNAAKSIVVDASIAHSAGETVHPFSRMCREFLETMRDGRHQFAANQELLDEWRRHCSRFSRHWLVSMVRTGRLASLPKAANTALWEAFGGEACPEKDYRNISKDLHLVDAALCTERRIASLDDQVRTSLRNCLEQMPEIGEIAWVNPVKEEERPLDWLRQGAPRETCRLLRCPGLPSPPGE